MPRVGLKLRLRLGGELPLDLIPDDTPFPILRGAIAWWDPQTASTLDLTTGLVDSWRDRVGDVALAGSGAGRPTYNTPGTFGGGTLNTLSFSGAQVLENLAISALMGQLDSNGAYTVLHTAQWTTGSASARASVCGVGIGSANITLAIGHQGSDYALQRARDASTLVQATHSTAVSAGAEWYIADYDGSNTVGIESSTVAKATATGASSLGAAYDGLRVGQGTGGLGYIDGELGDLVLFDRQLSGAELSEAKAWLATRI